VQREERTTNTRTCDTHANRPEFAVGIEADDIDAKGDRTVADERESRSGRQLKLKVGACAIQLASDIRVENTLQQRVQRRPMKEVKRMEDGDMTLQFLGRRKGLYIGERIGWWCWKRR
jgi:hypothetical protein